MTTPRPAHRSAEISPHLIARAQSDREAFGQIYDHYLPRVYAFCWLYSKNREEAEDLTAHTFERALVAIGRYQERGLPFSSWLLRIAGNAATDRARRLHRGGAQQPDVTLLADEDRIDNWLPDWEEAFWMREHLELLPADQQEVIRLRFYEDRSFLDVAARMGRSEGAVKQLLRRALKALLALLEQEVGAVDVG